MKRFLLLLSMILIISFALWAEGTTEDNAPEATSITLWTTEEQPERLAVQEAINQEFEALTGISVDLIPVSENQMGERATAAFAAGDLPDVIYHPLNFTLTWADAGMLDTLAATEVIESLGSDTYANSALRLVEMDGEYAGVPVDAWAQLIVYRKDLFDANNLAPPTTFDAIEKAITALHDPPNMYGFIAATDPSQGYMMQVFEFLALANGVSLVDASGNTTVNTPKLVKTLEFYKKLAEASPPGNLYWQQSRELYMAGQAAMIIWSPFILDELAGLRDSVPVTAVADPTSRDLAGRTGMFTRISGPDNAAGAGWADVRYFGITRDANVAAAQQFVEFSLNNGYVQTLAIAPEGKFPIRNGTKDDPTAFISAWKQLEVGVDRKAPLSEIYSDSVINDLIAGLEAGSRWGFQNNNGLLTSRLYETRGIIEMIREFLDGQYTAEETARLIAEEVDRNK